MIEIQVTTKLQTSDFPWNKVMQGVSEMMIERVRRNFIEGGRVSPWTPKRDGSASHLIETGRLFNCLENTWDETFAKVSTTGGLPYAAVHQYGGSVHHPGSDKPQAFTVDGVRVFTSNVPAHDIPIPQRPYMVLGEQDVDEIVQYLEATIVDHYNNGREAANAGQR